MVSDDDRMSERRQRDRTRHAPSSWVGHALNLDTGESARTETFEERPDDQQHAAWLSENLGFSITANALFTGPQRTLSARNPYVSVPRTWLDTSPNWWIDTLSGAIGWGPGRGTGILGLVWEGLTPGTLTLVIIHGWAFNDPNDPGATGSLEVQSESNSILVSSMPASDIAIVFTPSTAVAQVEIRTVGNLSFFEFFSATLQQ